MVSEATIIKVVRYCAARNCGGYDEQKFQDRCQIFLTAIALFLIGSQRKQYLLVLTSRFGSNPSRVADVSKSGYPSKDVRVIEPTSRQLTTTSWTIDDAKAQADRIALGDWIGYQVLLSKSDGTPSFLSALLQ
jgi:hypothetical protein